MTAIYAGSFDPFTNGHLDVAREAAQIFDHVIIVCAVNSKKAPHFGRDKMRDAIAACICRLGIHNVDVIMSNELIADIASEYGAGYLIRGLRNTMDFMYEDEIAKFNHRMNPELRTVYIRAADDALSSSVVRELLSHGKDVFGLVPEEILTIIKE